MNEFDFLSHEQLREHLYVVHESFEKGSCFNIFVVTGDDKTAVFDAGFGVTGGLRRYIETCITDKTPMVCYTTHGDLDHIGGAALFDEVYMNERELPKLEWNLNVERRFSDLKMFSHNNQELIEFCRKHYICNEHLKTKNIEDGDEIDLGNIKLEAIKLPGHTPGSLAYYNRTENYAIMGDAILRTSSWQRCRDLQECLDCYTRFIEMVPEDIILYSNHGYETQTIRDCLELKQAFEEILAGDTQEDEPFQLIFEYIDPEELEYDVRQHKCGSYNVPYDSKVLPQNT